MDSTTIAEHPDLPVSGALGYGRAAPSLLEMSDQAALIAVGKRGSGGFHRAAAEEVLDRSVGDIEQDVTDVKIERLVRPGPPARVLLEASADAAAIVVGARGLGGFAGLVLGSVSQRVLRHAPCPAVIAH